MKAPDRPLISSRRRPLHLRRALAPERAWLFSVLVALGCAHATVDDKDNENIMDEDPDDEDPLNPGDGGSSASGGSGGFIITGGQNSGGEVSTGGEWIGDTPSGGQGSGGTSTGGMSSGGTSSGGTSSGGANTGGSGASCDEPSITNRADAQCGSTLLYNGALYECIASDRGSCGGSGIYCQTFNPDADHWGPQGWSKIMDC